MKKVFELLVCIFHPVAVVLMWIDLATRRDLGTGAKLAWALFGLIPLGRGHWLACRLDQPRAIVSFRPRTAFYLPGASQPGRQAGGWGDQGRWTAPNGSQGP
jgi:hypothetical protein